MVGLLDGGVAPLYDVDVTRVLGCLLVEGDIGFEVTDAADRNIVSRLLSLFLRTCVCFLIFLSIPAIFLDEEEMSSNLIKHHDEGPEQHDTRSARKSMLIRVQKCNIRKQLEVYELERNIHQCLHQNSHGVQLLVLQHWRIVAHLHIIILFNHDPVPQTKLVKEKAGHHGRQFQHH